MMIDDLLLGIKVVFFDADGCILDSSKANRMVHEMLTGRVPSESLRNSVKGLNHYEAWKIICKEYKLKETPEEIIKRREEMMQSIYPELPLKEGVEEFLEELRERNIQYCITASCNKEHLFQKLLGHKDILNNAKIIVTNESDVQPKPSSDLFLKALRSLPGISPVDVLVVDDSVKGIQAALNCNMHTLLISSSEKNEIPQTLMLNSLLQLKSH